ncbi:MAG: hypothetical protein HQ510_04030 [Candidatus Marinimicrobia bacterium]|nr:hypothetical protein [Candidatus Neomarinimicrobiota bacterium]
MRRLFKSLTIFIIPGFLLINNCDNRVSEETDSGQYTITVTTTSFSGSSLVGEDVVGPQASTRVTGTVLNVDEEPIEGILIGFEANVSGQTYGSFDLQSGYTDDDGIISVVYTDGADNGAVDDPSTSQYEGVKVTAKNNNSIGSAKYNVYPNLDVVWPYKMFLSSDLYTIPLSNGMEKATIETRLRNKLNIPLPNVLVAFTSDRGYIDPTGVTDANGSISLEFNDNGTQEDIGVANIKANFTHPGASAEISDSVQITISTQYSLALESFPVFLDDNNNVILVGEDVAGDYALTMIVATVLDTAQIPVTGANIIFTAQASGLDVGTLTILNSNTNSSGRVIAFFDDGDNVYQDTQGTPNFEGVIIRASYGEDLSATTKFNVFDQSDVWPYSLLIHTDTDVIYLRDLEEAEGVDPHDDTRATISVRLLNALGHPVKNAEIAYSVNHGFIVNTSFTDSIGVDTVYFSHLDDPYDIGITTVEASFVHPGFSLNIANSVQVNIEDNTFIECAYIEIPSSNPGHIVVKDGGGLESTFIRAEVYDYDGNLIDTPTPVTFLLQPAPPGALLDETGIEVTSYTVNGVASVTINSGTTPGVVRVVVTVDCDDDPNTANLTSIAEPVIISSGAPKNMEAVWDPNGTTPDNGGGYITQVEALVWDVWFNQVEDTTYVYWTIDPVPPDTHVVAFVEGVSFTNNENWTEENFTGHAYSTVHFAPEAIGDLGRVTATTYGANGDTITARINNDEDAQMYFVPGQVIITNDISYYDFTLEGTSQILVTATVMVIDFYGNAVKEVPVSFSGVGVDSWVEVPNYPIYQLFGPTVDTDQNGFARISAIFLRELCIFQNMDDSDPDNPVCTYEDFEASITGTLMISQVTSSDPGIIQLRRSPDDCTP